MVKTGGSATVLATGSTRLGLWVCVKTLSLKTVIELGRLERGSPSLVGRRIGLGLKARSPQC